MPTEALRLWPHGDGDDPVLVEGRPVLVNLDEDDVRLTALEVKMRAEYQATLRPLRPLYDIVQTLEARLAALEGAESRPGMDESLFRIPEDPNQHSLPEAADDRHEEIPVPELPSPSTQSIAFTESTWNIIFVLGLIDVSWAETILSVSILLVTPAVQVAFLLLISSESFLGENFHSRVEDATKWRLTTAHDPFYMDQAGTSLAARVCSSYSALIMSNGQSDLLDEVNAYLGLQGGPGDAAYMYVDGSFAPGALLCLLCIGLWSLSVCIELRAILDMAVVTAALPHSPHSQFKGGALCMSRGRRIELFGFLALRAVIASWLAFVGVQWLVGTAGIQDLILNSAALAFVLDIDEMMFVALLPRRTLCAVIDLPAVEVSLSARISCLEPAFLLFSMAAILPLAYMTVVSSLVEDMAAVKSNMCGGNLNFVVDSQLDTQLYLWLPTTTVDEDPAGSAVNEQVVNGLAYATSLMDPVPAVKTETEERFKHFMDPVTTMEFVALSSSMHQECFDIDSFANGSLPMPAKPQLIGTNWYIYRLRWKVQCIPAAWYNVWPAACKELPRVSSSLR